LTPQPLEVLAITVDLSLIPIDLLLLLVIGYFMPLQLVPNQSTGAQPKAAANGCACTGMTHSSPNEATGSCSAKRADASAFFTSTQRSAGTACEQ
jgi:hypothetical protein